MNTRCTADRARPPDDSPSIVVTRLPAALEIGVTHEGPRLAVEQNRASAALALPATVLGPGQAEVLSKHIEQRPLSRRLRLEGLSVDFNRESRHEPHLPSARSYRAHDSPSGGLRQPIDSVRYTLRRLMANTPSRRSFLAAGALASAAQPLAAFAASRGCRSQVVDALRLGDHRRQVRLYSRRPRPLREGLHQPRHLGLRRKASTPHRAPITWSRASAGASAARARSILTGSSSEVRRSGFFEGAQSGMFVAVLTAVETALWDLAGKALGVPVYQLLGGKFRDRVRLYMDTALYQFRLPEPEKFAESAKARRRHGLHRGEVRPRSSQRPEQVRPLQLDGESG